MTGAIAWIRLSVYFGASILLLTEIYRLLLILLTILIFAPQITAFFQNLVLWGILIGFGILTTGFYKLLKSYPPLLDTEQYPTKKIKSITILGTFLSILIAMLLVLPPITYVSSDFQLIFSIFTSSLWLFYYVNLCLWIIFYWKLIKEITFIPDVIKNIKKGIHLILGIIISGFWLLDLFSWILIQNSIFNYDFMNIIYIIILILFLLNQILFFFRVRKFSYIIYG
ncbi:MAG: hypothetical protein HeimC3_42330 [Candidatus Heimdallarchaeota archaeon LC_3]|nr:MAG: hypothetical protein HeimC3_42330 [Candidatus Heimdallarchaeota archaeon LC_3]